jgi:hypothetical protein
MFISSAHAQPIEQWRVTTPSAWRQRCSWQVPVDVVVVLGN